MSGALAGVSLDLSRPLPVPRMEFEPRERGLLEESDFSPAPVVIAEKMTGIGHEDDTATNNSSP